MLLLFVILITEQRSKVAHLSCLLLCLPCHGGLYPFEIVGLNKPFIPYTAFLRVFYYSNRKETKATVCQ